MGLRATEILTGNPLPPHSRGVTYETDQIAPMSSSIALTTRVVAQERHRPALAVPGLVGLAVDRSRSADAEMKTQGHAGGTDQSHSVSPPTALALPLSIGTSACLSGQATSVSVAKGAMSAIGTNATSGMSARTSASGLSGKHLLALSFTGFDPCRTSAI